MIATVPTLVLGTAVVVALPAPVTPELLRFWSLTKPLTVVVSVGLAAP